MRQWHECGLRGGKWEKDSDHEATGRQRALTGALARLHPLEWWWTHSKMC